MPNDSLNSLIWKAESLRDLKYCSFWGAITCDLISYAFQKKNVEAILRRRTKWLIKWTFTIGEKKNLYYHQSSERDSKKYVMRLDSEDLRAGKSPKFILQPSAKSLKTWFYSHTQWVSWSFLTIWRQVQKEHASPCISLFVLSTGESSTSSQSPLYWQ